ncbi:hypothetical protein BWK47_15460 [Synechocystis sp. CACIAM 05]|jgi:hypothetical protein|nr:hypothetical protein BWK47_15460 [Synechocystis sp. CACIAM 05]
MAINSNSNSKVSQYRSQLNTSLSLEDLEDLQDLRRAKQKQNHLNDAVYSLEEVKQVDSNVISMAIYFKDR